MHRQQDAEGKAMKFKTIREAAEHWVREMDFVDSGLIKDAIREKEYVWNEITPLTVGKTIYCYDGIGLDGECHDGYGEIIKIIGDQIVVKMNDTEKKVLANKGYAEEETREWFPMWGTMFQPKERFDEEWIADNLQKVADCGFRIYEHDDYGIFLGIDGCGYDFYSEHWIPLYKARGLQWHEEEK